MPDLFTPAASPSGAAATVDAGLPLAAEPSAASPAPIAREDRPGHVADAPVTDHTGAVVGVVDGSSSTSTQRFHVVLNPERVVQLDDLLCVTRALPDGNTVTHYGIVVEIHGQIEEAKYSSDTPHVTDGTLPGTTSRVAEVQVLRNDPEIWVPPDPGAATHALSGADRDRALFRDVMSRALPLGLDRSNQPVWADWSFLNGEKGGHISISGISGVATKTSYALFALYMLMETGHGRTLLGAHAPNTSALVFNVKSTDLLYLDLPNRRFAGDVTAQAQWSALDVVDPKPFRSVHLYAPRRESRGGANTPDTERTDGTVVAYGWSPYAFIRDGLLDFCFTDIDDNRGANQIGFVAQRVRSMLQRHAFPSSATTGAVVILENPPPTAPREMHLRAATAPPTPECEITNFEDLVAYLDNVLDPTTGNPAWQAGVQPATLNAFLRRLYAAQPRIGRLMACGVDEVDAARGGITVVDIHSLHDAAQRFVVGALLHQIFTAKQGQGRLPLQYIVLDELNRYAPKQGTSPIKEILVDIAARGRSMGVLLIGAQQSAADVDANITRNASMKVVGRLDAGDSADYGFLTPELRQRAMRFLPGTMILDQPIIPAPIPVRFPFPPYATCQDEADTTPSPSAAAVAASVFSGTL